MCQGDVGLKNLMRDTEARVAPFAQAMNEDRQDEPAVAGLIARLRGTLAGWMRKEVRHV